ncbi:methyltransferase type 11 domain containing protein [Nitzschia inconspicua]|uniref:Methyltransferase type 11 domain containing protein n=1 Tax=Nitzschia inconspicua TaxID=303405 RepID=A0A9K3PLT9_9STRA|nr:methyltransferase type 11 domain containing protein [Nitzschia inconspicua]
MKKFHAVSLLWMATLDGALAFVPHSMSHHMNPLVVVLGAESTASTDSTKADALKTQKRKLLELIGPRTYKDPVLADPITKEGVEISASKPALGSSNTPVPFQIRSPSNTFRGSSDTYLDLLEPVEESNKKDNSSSSSSSPFSAFLQQAIPYIPPNLRGRLSSSLTDGDFIPMRDLFTNPAVSFAYERGWRQNFATAGFPGPDTEAQMAMDYFAPVVARVPDDEQSVVVDMSCATGLFTRRFALSEKYGRVLGCDYSPSMLTEARRRIDTDAKLSSKDLKTSLDLVRLDVGRIPMRNETVDCLHAGAAMHCWPDLDAAASEIYRVLKPGGRYFATTFLSGYFATMSAMDGQANTPPSQQAFQYFESTETLRELLVHGGFDREKIMIEVLGAACVVIRAEK